MEHFISCSIERVQTKVLASCASRIILQRVVLPANAFACTVWVEYRTVLTLPYAKGRTWIDRNRRNSQFEVFTDIERIRHRTLATTNVDTSKLIDIKNVLTAVDFQRYHMKLVHKEIIRYLSSSSLFSARESRDEGQQCFHSKVINPIVGVL